MMSRLAVQAAPVEPAQERLDLERRLGEVDVEPARLVFGALRSAVCAVYEEGDEWEDNQGDAERSDAHDGEGAEARSWRRAEDSCRGQLVQRRGRVITTYSALGVGVPI